MRYLIVVGLLVCLARPASGEAWLADISEAGTTRGQPDSVSIWLPCLERVTVGVYETASIRVSAPPAVSAKIFVQYMRNRIVYRGTPEEHYAQIPYWLPSRRWRPPGQETGGPYAVQLQPREVGEQTVSIRCDGGEELTVLLHVVEPIPGPDMGFGFYTVPAYFAYPLWYEYFEHMRDLRNNTFTIYPGYPQEEPREGEDETTIPSRNIAWQLDFAIETGLIDGSVPVFVFAHDPTQLDNAYKYAKHPERWPQLLGYGKDEPSCSERGEWEARGMVTMFNQNGAKPYRCGSAISDAAILRFGDGIDIWVCYMGDMSDLIKREAVRQNKDLWAYCCAMRGTNAPLNRYLTGWWCFKTRPRAFLSWVYLDIMTRWGDPPSCVHEDGSWSPCGYYEYALQAPDGPISSVGAEARRDGIVDYMVLRDLERAILAAEIDEPSAPGHYKLVREACQWLQNNMDRVSTNFWPNDEIPSGGCEAGQSCHWDPKDTALAPIVRFNELRKQAIQYTQLLSEEH